MPDERKISRENLKDAISQMFEEARNENDAKFDMVTFADTAYDHAVEISKQAKK